MTLSADLCARLAACAERTAHGSARFALTVTLLPRSSDADDWQGGTVRGVVDFDSDRCRLDGDQRAVLDGPATYTEGEAGTWALDDGTSGRWALFHPRVALEALRRACTSAEVVAERRFAVELDRAALDRIVHVGVWPGWVVSAEIVVDGAERVISATLKFQDSSGSAMHQRYEFDRFAGPVRIDLPRSVIAAERLACVDEVPDEARLRRLP